MGITRRRFLNIAAAELTSLVVGCKSVPKTTQGVMPSQISHEVGQTIERRDDVEEAKRLFANFPKRIPGIEEIRRYEVPGAKKILIHTLMTPRVGNIGQVREGVLRDGVLTKEEYERLKILKSILQFTNFVQGNMYRAFSYLSDEGILSRVFRGGVTLEEEEQFQRREGLVKDYTDYLKEIDESGLFRNIRVYGLFKVLTDMKERNFSLYRDPVENEKVRIKMEREFEQVRYIPGADLLLAMEGRIKISPLETTGAYNKLDRFMNFIGDPTQALNPDGDFANDYMWIVITNEDREDGILEYLANSDDKMPFVNLGMSHSFAGRESFGNYDSTGRVNARDNLYLWNATNPNNMFSLIELLPEGVRDAFYELENN